MDLLLERFLEHGYPHLGPAAQEAFEEMLDLPDQQILGWITGAGHAPDDRFRELAEQIRTTGGLR